MVGLNLMTFYEFGQILMMFDDLLTKFDEIDQIITVTGLITPGINKLNNIF